MAKLNFPVFSVTWSFRNYSNMLIWCSRNISYYYQCWKKKNSVETLINIFMSLW